MFNYQGSQNQISYTYTALISEKKQRKMYPLYKNLIINILDKSMGSCKTVLSAPSFDSTYSPFAFTSLICFNSEKPRNPNSRHAWKSEWSLFSDSQRDETSMTVLLDKSISIETPYTISGQNGGLDYCNSIKWCIFLYISYFVFRLLHSLLSTRKNNVAAFGRLLILYNTALDFRMNFYYETNSSLKI